MDQQEKETLLKISQMLIDKGDYTQALNVLNTMDCIMALWLKGTIYLSLAEDFSKSFTFKYYATSNMTQEYKNLLNEAYNYLYKASLLIPTVSFDIREHLNKSLWSQLFRVESELARTRTETLDENSLDDYYYEIDEERITENLIDEMIHWNL